MITKGNLVVAMSGGVDSSVAAAILTEQGYSVTGIMLKLWSDDCSQNENACCPPEAINQARQVAGLLNIPFYVIDVKDLFKKEIVDLFIEGCKKGITPNPCFFCNKNIRWGFLLDRIIDSKFEFLATGHYAQVEKRDDYFVLKKGIDASKDQSYVLSGLSQFQLMHSIFPLGRLRKTEVRELARKYNLPVAEKHDSQDLCFVGGKGYINFLKRMSPESFVNGLIKDTTGKQLGEHSGLVNYTIGQRKGIGSGFQEPRYVIEKNSRTNELIVGTKDELGKDKFYVNLISESPLINNENSFTCDVKIRYKALPVESIVTRIEKNEFCVKTKHPLRDITPGQIAVFYHKDEVIASGEIFLTQPSGENK